MQLHSSQAFGEGKVGIHHWFRLKSHTYIYVFKELSEKYKFDYFSDKRKINAFQISLDYKGGGN